MHTLRADIDYGFAEADTTYGVIGVKTWVYRGEVLEPRGGSAGLGSEPEPRRMEPRERRERRAPQPRPEAPATEPAGPPVQAAPIDLPRPARGAPILPPLMAPQPAWKQEVRQEGAEPKPPETPPEEKKE